MPAAIGGLNRSPLRFRPPYALAGWAQEKCVRPPMRHVGEKGWISSEVAHTSPGHPNTGWAPPLLKRLLVPRGGRGYARMGRRKGVNATSVSTAERRECSAQCRHFNANHCCDRNQLKSPTPLVLWRPRRSVEGLLDAHGHRQVRVEPMGRVADPSAIWSKRY